MSRLLPEYFRNVTRFDWDEGNAAKNWTKHEVSRAETEQVFFNRPIVVVDARRDAGDEVRYFALGKTDTGRRLTVVFTLRAPALRVISARPMSRQERVIYGKTEAS
jgi:uncharacterized protein